ncbi:MAG: hypothetical protein Roseis2KO_17120 [Roseivirga sp.]
MKISAITILIFLTGTGLTRELYGQNDSPISYKTLSILNENFVVTNDWGNVKLNISTGEDLNSKRFGGIYYPAKAKGSEKVENRTSVAMDFMEIEISLQNKGSDTWLLEAITLEIIEVYDVSSIDLEKGSWEAGSRTMDYNPSFGIEYGKNKVTDIPNDVVIEAREEFQDTNMILEVEAPQGGLDKQYIYQFRFRFNLAKVGGKKEKLAVISDKTYFLASK